MCMKNVIKLLMFIGIFCSCSSPNVIENEPLQMRYLEEILMTNILNIETFDFPTGIELIDEQGKKINIDSVFIKPKLVMRFDYSCCEKCIETELENIYKIYGKRCSQFVVGIGSYENPRSLRLIKQKFRIEIPVYFLPIQEGEHIFPQALVKLHYPYLFIMNRNLKAKHIFIPMSELPEISCRYYKAMHSLLTEEKESLSLFSEQQIDLGKIKIDEECLFRFSYTNTMEQPVIINDVKTTCGCTVPSWEKKPLLPGKTETLTIKFTPNTLGFHVKKIFVYTNIDNDPIPLSMKAVVIK